MKTTKSLHFTACASAALFLAFVPHTFARESTDSQFSGLEEAAPEPPKTASEKLQSLQQRHQTAFSELSITLNRLPTDPDFLGTKELFAEIDKSGRDMKNIRTGCTALMSSLRADFKVITDSPSFTEDQKQELKEAAETLGEDCTVLTKKLDVAISRLDAAYTILPKWNKIYKAYRNLQGNEKAAEQVRANVEDYLKSFTPEPEPAAAEEETLEE